VVDAHGCRGQPAAHHLSQRLGALLEILVERIRVHPDPHVAAVVRALLVEHDQLVGVRDRQLPEQDLVDQRKNRGVGANPERQREDGHGGEQRTAAGARRSARRRSPMNVVMGD
jgi:hypothetical protein